MQSTPPPAGPQAQRLGPRARALIAAVSFLTLAAAGVYLLYRLASLLQGGAPWPVLAFTTILVAGEVFFFAHGFGYTRNVLRSRRHLEPPLPTQPVDLPPVAVFVASFNEPVEVLRPTLEAARAMDYPRVSLYLVDDSTAPGAPQALADLCAQVGAKLLRRPQRRGFKAGALNDALAQTSEPLLLLLDADQRPSPGFLADNVPRLLASADAAFIQTPQVYGNIGDSLVAFSAEVQQAPFYDFACAGKDTVNAAFFLGTNVILKRSAVEAAGGFAEDSVTEDFVTTYRLHRKGGWRTLYHSAPGVVGEGPPNLLAYFNQQYRWAFGNVRLLPEYFKDAWRRTAFTRAQRREYRLGISWWFIGWANLALALLPPAFFFLGARVLGTGFEVYLAALLPYLVLSNLLGVLALRSRGYSGRGVLLAQSLTLVAFPVYIKATLDAARGRRVPFKVTRKGKGLVYVPFRTLWPQLLLLLLNALAASYGVWVLIEEPVLSLVLMLVITLAVMGAWELLTRARELKPLKLARQRRAWRAFQAEIVAFLVVTAAFLVGLDIIDVASRTPDVWPYFLSQWEIARANLVAAPYLLVNLFWAYYNMLFLYGTFMFRVDTR